MTVCCFSFTCTMQVFYLHVIGFKINHMVYRVKYIMLGNINCVMIYELITKKHNLGTIH